MVTKMAILVQGDTYSAYIQWQRCINFYKCNSLLNPTSMGNNATYSTKLMQLKSITNLLQQSTTKKAILLKGK